MFTTKVIKSHVKLEVKSNATKIPRESTPYITLTLHFSVVVAPSKIFSACCNTSRGIKLAAPQSRPSSLGLLVGKKKHENTYFSKQNQKKSKDNDSYHNLYETTITAPFFFLLLTIYRLVYTQHNRLHFFLFRITFLSKCLHC